MEQKSRAAKDIACERIDRLYEGCFEDSQTSSQEWFVKTFPAAESLACKSGVSVKEESSTPDLTGPDLNDPTTAIQISKTSESPPLGVSTSVACGSAVNLQEYSLTPDLTTPTARYPAPFDKKSSNYLQEVSGEPTSEARAFHIENSEESMDPVIDRYGLSYGDFGYGAQAKIDAANEAEQLVLIDDSLNVKSSVAGRSAKAHSTVLVPRDTNRAAAARYTPYRDDKLRERQIGPDSIQTRPNPIKMRNTAIALRKVVAGKVSGAGADAVMSTAAKLLEQVSEL